LTLRPRVFLAIVLPEHKSIPAVRNFFPSRHPLRRFNVSQPSLAVFVFDSLESLFDFRQSIILG
ncbi:MAG: hypothetical protein ABFS02_11655, partial [Pseudomonadota bacterium]